MARVHTTTAGFLPGWSGAHVPNAVVLQRGADLDRFVTGQQDWVAGLAEPLRRQPGVSRVPALGTRPVCERPYVRTGPFRSTGILDTDGGVSPTRLQVVIPGPYTITSMIDDQHAPDEFETFQAVTDWLEAEIDRVPPHHGAMLLEPALVDREPGPNIVAELPRVIDRLAGPLSAPILHTWGGSPSPKVHAYLLDADIHAVGYDCAASPEGTAELLAEFGTTGALALGCLDATNGIGLAAETITELIERFLDRAFASTADPVYVLPNRPLAELPIESIAAMLVELGRIERERTP